MDQEKETAKKEETVQKGRVSVTIPRGSSNDEPNLLVGINGKNYVLPRGQTSQVPPEVAVEVERSIKAQEQQYKSIDAMSNRQ